MRLRIVLAVVLVALLSVSSLVGTGLVRGATSAPRSPEISTVAGGPSVIEQDAGLSSGCEDSGIDTTSADGGDLCIVIGPAGTNSPSWPDFSVEIYTLRHQALSHVSAAARLTPWDGSPTTTVAEWSVDPAGLATVGFLGSLPKVAAGNYTLFVGASATTADRETHDGSAASYLSISQGGAMAPISAQTADAFASSGRLQSRPPSAVGAASAAAPAPNPPAPLTSCGAGQIYVTGQVFYAQMVSNAVSGNLPLTPHPYSDNSNLFWSIVDKGASQITLFFSQIDIQSGYDHLKVMDANWNVVWQTDTGYNGERIYTNQYVTVNTDVVYVSFTSNADTHYWGFELNYWYRNSLWHGAKWVTIEIWDASIFGDSLLQSLQAGADGSFTSSCLSNSDEWGTRDIYFKAVLETDKGVVRMDGGDPYRSPTDTKWDVPDGHVDFGSWYTTTGVNPAYIIYNALVNAWDFLKNGVGFTSGKATAIWTWGHDASYYLGDSGTTHYHYNGGSVHQIHVNFPHAESPEVILHEYGHYAMQEAYNDWYSSDWGCNPHSWTSFACNAGAAWAEGFADFFFAPVVIYTGMNNQWFNDYFQQFSMDLEATPWWNEVGPTNEGSVAAALYDVYDNNVDGADTYAMGFGAIWAVMRYAQQTTIADWFSSWRSVFASSAYDIHYCKVDLYQNKINYNTNLPTISSFATVTAPINGYFHGTVQVHAYVTDADWEDANYLRVRFMSSPTTLDPWFTFYDVTGVSGWRDGYWPTTSVSDGIQYLAGVVDDQMWSIGSGILGPEYVDNTPPAQPGSPSWPAYDERDGAFTISWTPSSDGYSGIWYYEIQQQFNGGAWTALSSTLTSPSYALTYAAPGSYNFRVRAEDRAGNWGTFSWITGTTIPGDARMTNNAAASFSPSIAVDRFGNYHIVWVDARDGNNEIYYKKVDANWNILVGDTRLTSNTADSIWPEITILWDNIYVVWSDNRDGNYEIYWKLFSGSWGSDTRLTTTAADSKEPDIAVLDGSNIFWVWREVDRSGTSEVEKVEFKAGVTTTDLYTWTGAKIAQTHSDRIISPHIALGASGYRHVVFSRGPGYPVEGGTSYMYYIRYASGSWGSVVQLGTNFDVARHPMIDADSSGHVYVVWEKWGNGFDVSFRKSDDSGSNWAAEQTFGGGSSSYQVYPDVAAGPSGKVYMTWMDNSAGQYEIYVQKSTNYGNAGSWGSAVRMTNSAGDSTWSRMVVDQSSGRVGLVWTDARDGNTEVYFTAKML